MKNSIFSISEIQTLRDRLEEVKKMPDWTQNIESVITVGKNIGNGSWGSVYEGTIDKTMIAVKYAKIKPEDISEPNSRSWIEIKTLKLFQPLFESGRCQNLLYLIDYFTTDKCRFDIEFKKKEQSDRCVVLLFERAFCSLKVWLNDERTLEEMRSCLFQIMFGLHVLQTLQIQHYDMKASNILVFKTIKNGCFEYTVNNKRYYVPDCGYVFVIADFGLARSLSPTNVMIRDQRDKTYRIGHRFAININGAFSPLENRESVNDHGKIVPSQRVKWKNGDYSMSGESRMVKYHPDDASFTKIVKTDFVITKEQRQFLRSHHVDGRNLYKHPMIIPPFEFYNDTQDVIRIFIGGKQMTQRGIHAEFGLDIEFLDSLRKYKTEDSGIIQELPREAYFVLAGEFINDYFKNMFWQEYGPILGKFKVSEK